MPEIGDIRKTGTHKQGYCACLDCGQARWVWLKRGEPQNPRCDACARNLRTGANSPAWRGGRSKASNGYILIWVSPTDFFRHMATSRGLVSEHRLVMAKHLGRLLHPWELIHHKNGIRDDNRLGNLQLIMDLGHKSLTLLESKIKQLQEENRALKAELKRIIT